MEPGETAVDRKQEPREEEEHADHPGTRAEVIHCSCKTIYVHIKFSLGLTDAFAVGMRLTTGSLEAASPSLALFPSLYASTSFFKRWVSVLASASYIARRWLFLLQEMVDFLVDVWEQEGLYDWALLSLYNRPLSLSLSLSLYTHIIIMIWCAIHGGLKAGNKRAPSSLLGLHATLTLTRSLGDTVQ